MSQGKDFTTDLHSQMVAEEKHAGVGDQDSCRPGELLTNKKSPKGSKHYSTEIQGHNPPKSVYKETLGTSQEGLGETHATSMGKKNAPEATSRTSTDGSRKGLW